MDYCCQAFEKDALSANGFEQDPDGETWNINGCCGGGCYVVTMMRFCPYCGSNLKHSGTKNMPIILSTGRVIDERIIGLVIYPVHKDDGKLRYGHDGVIPTFEDCSKVGDAQGPEYLSKQECRELASHMIIEWTKYRDSIK